MIDMLASRPPADGDGWLFIVVILIALAVGRAARKKGE